MLHSVSVKLFQPDVKDLNVVRLKPDISNAKSTLGLFAECNFKTFTYIQYYNEINNLVFCVIFS